MGRKHIQQGDVNIIHIDGIPKGAKKVSPDRGRSILAYGEATGHAHAASPEAVEMFEKDGTLYMRVLENDEPAKNTVTHEEHKTSYVAPGDYEIRNVVEKDPFENVIRQVRD